MRLSYDDFLKRDHFTKEELLAYSWADLIENPPMEGCGLLPSPPMLMFDRVVEISHKGKRGRIVAEQDVAVDDWFFQCHFRADQVMPGCLGVDAVWQLLGFYAIVRGAKGAGRALGSKEIEFFGQVRPHNKLVRYELEVKRYAEMASKGAAMAIASAKVLVDGEEIYSITDAKVGIFKGIQYKNYPHTEDPLSVGGKL